MKIKPQVKTINEYIRAFPKDVQRILGNLRQIVRTAAPDAQETISYGMPAFNLNSKYLLYFAAWKNHISFYPIPSGPEIFQKQLATYIKEKGTIQFPLDKPVPYDLVGQIVRYRVKEALEEQTKDKQYDGKETKNRTEPVV